MNNLKEPRNYGLTPDERAELKRTIDLWAVYQTFLSRLRNTCL
jgi:hypothetical protein